MIQHNDTTKIVVDHARVREWIARGNAILLYAANLWDKPPTAHVVVVSKGVAVEGCHYVYSYLAKYADAFSVGELLRETSAPVTCGCKKLLEDYPTECQVVFKRPWDEAMKRKWREYREAEWWRENGPRDGDYVAPPED